MMSSLKIGLLAASTALVAVPTAWHELSASSLAPARVVHVPHRAAGTTQVGNGSEESFDLAPFGPVSLYQPKGPVRGVVLFLSGDGGWNLGVVDMARAMAAKGALVAGVSTPAFLKALEADSSKKCISPNAALVALAQAAENRAGFTDYLRPVIAGYSSGATLAFVTLAQAPHGLYDGAMSLGFSPDLPGRKPWCAADGFTASPITKPEAGWLFGAKTLPAPWVVLQGLDDQVIDATVTRNFVKTIPQAELIELPKVGHGFAVEANWMPQFSAAFDRLVAHRPGEREVSGLPLDIVADAQAPATDTMAVLYSGDGGWAGLDQQVAGTLAAKGIPVVGVDSLRYYWNAKSPAEAGRDLGAILARYGRQWNRAKAIVIGYSFGADALPFAVDTLPPDVRSHIVRLAMMGLDSNADLQFHLSSWLNYSGGASRPTVPAINALKGMNIECLRGRDEDDSACDQIAPGVATQVVLPGGHHFDGDYQRVANALAKGVA